MPDAAPRPDPAQLDAMFAALSDARRRAMIAHLSRVPLSVSELAGPLGLAMPSAVKHLAVLEAGGLVQSEKVGRVRTFRLKPQALDPIRRWIDQREAELTAAFDRLEQALADDPETPGQ